MKKSAIKNLYIPEDWDELKFRQIFWFGKGLSITKDDLVDEGIPVVSYGQVHSKINSGTGLCDDLFRYVPESYLRTSRNCIVRKNDFIFADTSEDYAGIGNCAFIDRDDIIFAGYHSIIARPIRNDIYPKYFAYLFLSNCWRDQIRASVMGIKVFSITQKLLRDTYVLIPSLDEQRAITHILDDECSKIDHLSNQLEKQIDQLKRYKKAIISYAVTRGLDVSVPMRDTGIGYIGEMPAHWNAKRMKYVLAKPLQYGANETGDDYNEDWPRYIRITDITENNELKDEGKQALPPDVAKPYLLKDGDVLFARSGATVGKTFYYTDDCGTAAFAGYLIKAQTDRSKVLPKFLYYSTLGTGYENWKNMVFTQATIQNIGADKYAQFIVTIPPLDEQKVIIEYLDSECGKIDRILAAKELQLETMTRHKQSLIYEYVTGKKRVKEVTSYAD